MFSKSLSSAILAVVSVAIAGSDAVAWAAKGRPERAPTYSKVFRVSPLAALEQIASLARSSGKLILSAREYKLLFDASQGRLQGWSMDEAAVIVAGATDDARIEHYLDELDDLAEQSFEATQDAITPVERVKALAKFLHDVPMEAGYVSGQASLCKVLDTGHYNCVSSAVLFNLMARRMGIQTGAVALPRHIFSRVDGYDIETTSGRVYPVSDRSRRVKESRKAKDNEPGSSFADRLFDEVSDAALLAEVYFSRAHQLCDDEHFGSSVAGYLKSVCLDQNSHGVANNLKSTFKKWFESSLKDRRYRQAATVASLYRQMLRKPTDADWMTKDLKKAVSSNARRPVRMR